MLRRSHKKSRGGCLQCKRRHVKCDEQRPACRLCVVSEQRCSFAAQGPSKSPSTEGMSSNDLVTATSAAPDTTRPPLYINPQINNQPDPTFENVINLDHMEFLLHVFHSKDLFSLGGDRDAHQEYLTVERAMTTGLQHPYLLHQLLAFSARHLATVHPSKAAFYMHHAITLQTRAVALFNGSYAGITRETCVPVLLFSTVLGHHVFADTLCRRDADDLDAFLIHFVPCLETLRGVHAIYEEARPLWAESALWHVLALSSSFTSRAPVGTRCQRAVELIEASATLGSSEKEACRSAIRYLEVGFDAVLAEREELGYRYQMLFLWCVLVPREFVALLAAKKVEALVVLGYYAVPLGYGRTMWQVMDAGEFILGHLRAYLGDKTRWDWST